MTPKFIERQRKRLEALHADLLGAVRSLVDDVRTLHEVQSEEAQAFESLAQV